MAGAQVETKQQGGPPSAFHHAVFFRTLGTMFEAAVPLPKAMELLEPSLVGPRLALAAENIKRKILRGVALNDAMATEGDAFTTLHLRMVKLGIETGSLHKVLLAVAEHDEKRYAMIAQLRSALFYPCLVFLACLAFLVVVPALMFDDLFGLLAGTGQQLPLLTRAVAGLSSLLAVPWTYVGLGLVSYGFWMGARKILREQPDVRLRLYRLAEGIPGLGPVLVSARLAHFTASLAIVMRSGLRLDRGLEIACQSCGSPLVERAALRMIEELRQGESLSTLLADSGLFPRLLWQAVASGEESGELPEMLTFLSHFYRRDLEYRLVGLTALLEPLALGVMGLLVGGLMVACIKPLAASFAQF